MPATSAVDGTTSRRAGGRLARRLTAAPPRSRGRKSGSLSEPVGYFPQDQRQEQEYEGDREELSDEEVAAVNASLAPWPNCASSDVAKSDPGGEPGSPAFSVSPFHSRPLAPGLRPSEPGRRASASTAAPSRGGATGTSPAPSGWGPGTALRVSAISTEEFEEELGRKGRVTQHAGVTLRTVQRRERVGSEFCTHPLRRREELVKYVVAQLAAQLARGHDVGVHDEGRLALDHVARAE